MSINIQVNGLSELLDKFRNFTSQADQIISDTLLESTQNNIVPLAKSLAPKRTGELVNSIQAIAGNEPMIVLLVAGKPYAIYLERGTKAHTIEAVNAKALAFKIDGKTVFARRVENPGIPEGKFSFLGPAIEEGKNKVIQDIANAILAEFE